MLSLLRLISARHLFDAKLRTVLTILGVAVGVATMVGVTAINKSVLSAFRSTIDTIAGKADLTVSGSLAGFDDELVDKVKAMKGVAHASGGVTKAATLETGLQIRVPLFIKEGEKVKVHTETREFAGRA